MSIAIGQVERNALVNLAIRVTLQLDQSRLIRRPE